MSFSQQISVYNDLMIVQTIAADAKMHKTASIIGDMASNVSSYVSGHMQSMTGGGSKFETLINLLGPGAISMAFGMMGMGWFGVLAGAAMATFQINITDIFSTIWGYLKDAIKGDKPITEQHVESIVNTSVAENAGEDTGQARTAEQLLRDARVIKLSMIEYERRMLSLTKEAAPQVKLPSTKSGAASILGRILSVFFKMALWSAGLMVAGGIIRHLMGGNESGSGDSSTPATPTATQNKFPINPSYSDQKHDGAWGVSVSNDPSSIHNMLISFAKEVYSGLDGKENLITSSPNFQKILSDIIWYNHASAGDKIVIIPKEFGSKKRLVDYFIGEVAKSSP